MATNHCFDAGFLVDVDEDLPDNPHDFWTGGPPLIGCSNILCMECHCPVRHVDRRRVPHVTSDDDMRELYDSPDPESSPLLLKDHYFRAYFCRCHWAEAGGVKLGASDLPWRCAGHPDDDVGTWSRRIERRAQLDQRALQPGADALEAWEELLAQEGADGVPVFRQLMGATRDWRVRGRAAMAIGRFTGEYKDAKSVLKATVENSQDAAASDEAKRLMAEIPS